jgi:hypothetical protein
MKLKSLLQQVKLEIRQIEDAVANPLLLQQINDEYADLPPITDIPHLNRLVRLVLPELKQQRDAISTKVAPYIPQPNTYTFPKKRYSRTYAEYLASLPEPTSLEERQRREAQSKAAKKRNRIKKSQSKKGGR